MSNGTIPVTVLVTKDNLTESSIHMGYYTSIIGIGKTKKILSNIIDITNNIGNEDNIFFKSLYNLDLQQNKNFDLTSSQMCPFRKCNFNKSVELSYNKNASGGYMADCNIKGDINFAYQPGSSAKSAGQFCAKNIICSGKAILGQKNFVFVDSKITGDSVKGDNSRDPNFINLSTGKLDNGNTFNTQDYPLIEKYLNDIVVNQNKSQYIIITKSSELSKLSSQIKKNSIILIMPNLYRDYSSSSNITINSDNVQIIGVGFPVLIGYTFNIVSNNCTLASLILDAKPLRFKQQYCIQITGNNNKLFDITTRTILGPGLPYSLYEDNAGVDKMFIVNGDSNYLENFWAWRGDHWTCYISKDNKPYPSGKKPSPSPSPPPSDLSNCYINKCDYGQPQGGWPEGGGPEASSQPLALTYNDCGAQCNSNANCKYFKQNGTWCGLYYGNEKINGKVIKAPSNFDSWKSYNCVHENDIISGISNNVNDADCNWQSSSGGGYSGNKNYFGAGCGGTDNSYGFGINAYDNNNYNPIGIHIIGTNCTILGSFVEHQNLYNIFWEGKNGIHVFNQGELSYTNFGTSKYPLINKISPSYLVIIGDNYYGNGLGIYNIHTPNTFSAINIQNEKSTTCLSSNIRLYNIILSSWWMGYGGLTIQYNSKKSGNVAPNNNIGANIKKITDFCNLLLS